VLAIEVREFALRRGLKVSPNSVLGISTGMS
jgi:hypothetical protein